jgi:hypothetical protein
VTTPDQPAETANVIGAGAVAVLYCGETFTFEPATRMRASRCLICGDMIGDRLVGIVGAAGLIGEPCRCGHIMSDVFLLHADHMPMGDAELQAAIERGLQCDYHNP